MPKLNEVITAILSSLSNAQHQSNQVSSQFASSYKNDETMKYFAMPNATVSEAEITLRYAIKDMAMAVMPHLRASRNIATESRFAAHLRAVRIINALMLNKKIQALFIDTDIDVRRIAMSRIDDISQVIYEGNKNGRDDEDIIRDIMEILQDTFSKFPEVSKNFENIFHTSDEIVKEAQTYIKENIDSINTFPRRPRFDHENQKFDANHPKDIANHPKGFRQKIGSIFSKDSNKENIDSDTEKNEENGNKDIEVIIDNDILQKLPESIIQTIKFKAHVKNYHWIVNEKSNSGEFILTD